MSDANVAGRWVTDAGDARIGDGYACWRLHGPSCGIGLSAPFYEPLGPRHPTETLCPACALAHFGVRPPGTETCGECGASPCDCKKPETWGLYWRAKGVERRTWVSCSSRPMAVRARSECLRLSDGYDLGPVQRITDVPYDFDAPPIGVRTDAACHAPGTNVRHTITAAAAQKPPAKCSLPWCSAPTRSTFCSSNCERAHEDRIAAVARREAFVHRMRERGKSGQPEDVGLIGEIAWAEAKADEEIETIRRAWSALRHTAAEGNEGAFASTGDEP